MWSVKRGVMVAGPGTLEWSFHKVHDVKPTVRIEWV
jgi:hypothetical protein